MTKGERADLAALVGRLRDQGFQYSANPLYDEAANAIEALAATVATQTAREWQEHRGLHWR